MAYSYNELEENFELVSYTDEGIPVNTDEAGWELWISGEFSHQLYRKSPARSRVACRMSL